MNLLAEYSSSSEDETAVIEKPKIVLPSAKEVLKKSKQRSVLETTYDRQVKHTNKILEQHVKMVDCTPPINSNQKICWMFKKGKCRYGSKCKHRHDTLTSTLAQEKKTINNVEETKDSDTVLKNKKRYGVTDTLVPPKKALKHIHSLQKPQT